MSHWLLQKSRESSIRELHFEVLLVAFPVCCVPVHPIPRLGPHHHSAPVGHSMTQHPPPPSPFSNVNNAALVAASKTSSTPSPVKDEHSRYFRAPMS